MQVLTTAPSSVSGTRRRRRRAQRGPRGPRGVRQAKDDGCARGVRLTRDQGSYRPVCECPPRRPLPTGVLAEFVSLVTDSDMFKSQLAHMGVDTAKMPLGNGA